MAGVGATLAALPFIKSLNPSERTKANKSDYRYVNIEKLAPGQVLSVSGVFKSIVILRRSESTLERLMQHNDNLLDPESNDSVQPATAKNPFRSIRPDILVVNNLCTHLGCSVAHSPAAKNNIHFADGGFFCPCHGAKYDQAGRVYKNMPAPKNLEVPNYEFIDENTLKIEVREGFSLFN